MFYGAGGAVGATLRQQIEALALTTETGRTNTGAAKDPLVDALPSGWAVNSGLLSGSTTPVTFDGWDMTSVGGKNLALYSNDAIDLTVTQCIMGEKDLRDGGFNWVQPRGAGSNVNISYTTFHGFDGPGESDNMLRRDWPTGDYNVWRCRFEDTTFDAVKLSNGSMWECYIGPPKNALGAVAPYDAGAAYVENNVVQGLGADDGRYYLALQASTGEALPSGTGSNAFWGYFEPHTDLINPADGTTYVGYVMVDVPANSDTFLGATNVIRSARDNNSQGFVGVAVVEGIVAPQTWRGIYPYDFGRQNNYSVGRSYSTGDITAKGPRIFESLVDSNLGNDPWTSPAQWQEVIYDNFEGPMVRKWSWISPGILGDYWYPYLTGAAVAEASRMPRVAEIHDNIYDATTGLPVQPPNYTVVENTPAPAFGTKTVYTPQAWSAEGNSWLIEATGEGQFHTEGGTIVDACVIQIGSSVVAYIEDGQAPTLIPSASHWTVTDEGAGVYRFHCESLQGSQMTGRARVLAGAATITAETVGPSVEFLGMIDGNDYAANAPVKTWTIPNSDGKRLVLHVLGDTSDLAELSRSDGAGGTVNAVKGAGDVTVSTTQAQHYALPAGTGPITVDMGNSTNRVMAVYATDLTSTQTQAALLPGDELSYDFTANAGGEFIAAAAWGGQTSNPNWVGLLDNATGVAGAATRIVTGGRERYHGYNSVAAGAQTLRCADFSGFKSIGGAYLRFT
jgi:hypothetical protein